MSVQPSNSSWSFQLTTAVVPNNIDVPIYPWFPDAHIAIVKNNINDEENDPNSAYLMFWSGGESYRSVGGPTPYPEDQKVLDPQTHIFGGRIDAEGYNNGGSWLNSVFRKSDISSKNNNTDRLIGFYHAEDHWWPRNTAGLAWKSMGNAISRDNGYTWQDQGQILTSSKPKPATPEWGGAADGSVIWHEADQRWICYYASNHMAMSEDPEGAPGTWFKYYDGDFTQPGLGGNESTIEGLKSASGGNPSVHFNTYLGLWIMVYHSWSPGCLYISSSIDAYDWSTPRQILCSSEEGGRAWYPTIIGESDVLAGEKGRLYYANIYNGTRDFIGQDIVFTKTDEPILASERLSQPPPVEPSVTNAITSEEDPSVAEELSDLLSSTRVTTTTTVAANTLPSDVLDSTTSSGGSVVTTPKMMMLGSSTLLGVSFFISVCT